MGKASSQAFKPHEVEAMARQQNYMSNPNQENYFGSTRTEFNDRDQATITQQMSGPMQQLLDSQMNVLNQGPAQLGNYSSSFFDDMIGSTAGNIARRGGYEAPSSDMGGFDGFNPQFDPTAPTPGIESPTQGPTGPTGPTGPIHTFYDGDDGDDGFMIRDKSKIIGPNPELSFGTNMPAQQEQTKPSALQVLGAGLSEAGGKNPQGGLMNQGGANKIGQALGALLAKKPNNQGM